jgi:hypothetical protein
MAMKMEILGHESRRGVTLKAAKGKRRNSSFKLQKLHGMWTALIETNSIHFGILTSKT